MSEVEAISALTVVAPEELASSSVSGTPKAGSPDFGAMLTEGIAGIEAKVASADALVREFTLDDTVPVHQVTMALEEARLAVDLAIQVRERLVEGYREIMNMQL